MKPKRYIVVTNAEAYGIFGIGDNIMSNDRPMQQTSPLIRLYKCEVKAMSDLLAIYPSKGISAQLYIDEDDRTVYLDGEPCAMTQQEFSLLNELAQNADRPVSRQELLRVAWGYISPGDTRTVDVHVQRLRKKLGFAAIETVYRYGYKLRASRR